MAKHIEFNMPVDWMTGNLSGHQSLEYGGGGAAYAQPDGERTSAYNYQPRIIAKRLHRGKRNARSYYQVRTRSTVNMTNGMRLTMAIMGGAGALFASLLRHKDAAIYTQCVSAKPKEKTLRQFMLPLLMSGLSDKVASIAIADGVSVVNPWVSSDTPNIQVSTSVLDKFNILS